MLPRFIHLMDNRPPVSEHLSEGDTSTHALGGFGYIQPYRSVPGQVYPDSTTAGEMKAIPSQRVKGIRHLAGISK